MPWSPRIGRRRLLQLALAGGGAGAVAVLGRGLAAAAAPTDVQLLSRLVVLEDQAVYLYGQLAEKIAPAATATPGGPVDLLAVVVRFGALHQSHRDVLEQTIRQAAGTPPATDGTYPQLLPLAADQGSVLAALTALETVLLGAYYGAQGAFTQAGLGANVASIFPVTARFQALLLAAQRLPPVPASFVVGSPAAAQAVTVPILGAPTSSSSSSST
ncbi:MAG TPA: ferritin-like domain-containing protein [Candidatus Dormibacteraeota bacterium]